MTFLLEARISGSSNTVIKVPGKGAYFHFTTVVLRAAKVDMVGQLQSAELPKARRRKAQTMITLKTRLTIFSLETC